MNEDLDTFCGSKFWDLNVTWYTENPDLTPCFEKTVLVWVPCAILWLFIPLEMYYMKQSKGRNIPWNLLNISKTFVVSLLVVLQIINVVYTIIQNNGSYEVFPVDYTYPVVLAITFIMSLILMSWNQKRGIRSSGHQFVFWLLTTIASAVTYRTNLMKATGEDTIEELVPFVVYMVYFPLVVAALLLNCWADSPPQYYTIAEVKTENPCPEWSSSFLSRILFTWFEPMTWKGFRKPLEMTDLWNLNPQDKSRIIVPLFDKQWDKNTAKINNKRQKSASHKSEYKEVNGAVEFSPSPKPTDKEIVSILPSLFRAFGGTFMFAALLSLITTCMIFISPQVLDLLIGYVQSKDEETWKGYFYTIILLVSNATQTIITNQSNHRLYLVCMHVRTSIVSAIYRKALRISNSARKESTVGEIVNLMSVDAQRICDIAAYINMIWTCPLTIGLSLYFLWGILGPSSMAGLAVMVILIPINGAVANIIKKLQIRQMKSKDQRVKLMNEVISGIKVLKLCAWETSFKNDVLKIRNQEVDVLKKSAYLNACLAFFWTCAPFLVALASFATYVLIDEKNVLDAQVAFVSLNLFSIMRMPLNMLPMMVVFLVQTGVSVTRINKFMNAEELNPADIGHDTTEKDAIVVENGSFSWSEDEPVILKNINIRIKEKDLVAIVGSVGAGKSSLLSGILGEMEMPNGRVNTRGNIAYVTQQAWIQNATLKDNILFGKSLERKKYDAIVDACALQPDFEILTAGDMTEIGEKGINLSGGQKQRVSLARAVYSDAVNVFLDDPLSAVDSHVGKHIFDKVIGPQGLLKDKTRVLVTHGITYLPQVDHIVVLIDGQISEEGTYKELLDKKGAFSEFLLEHISQRVGDKDAVEPDLGEIIQQLESAMGTEEFQRQLSRQKSRLSDSHSETSSLSSHQNMLSRQVSRISAQGSPSNVRKRHSVISKTGSHSSVDKPSKTASSTSLNNKTAGTSGKLIDIEKAETGSVKMEVYWYYLKSVGLYMSIAILVLQLLYQGFSVGSSIWLSVWSNEPVINGTQDADKTHMYLGVYAAFGVGQAISVLISHMVLALSTLSAAATIHEMMLQRILRSPMSFYDTTPLGRILNRFGKDIDVMDNTIPMNIRMFINCVYSVCAVMVVICMGTPIFVAVIVPMSLVYYLIQRFYVSTSRQLKRIESVTRSPIYSHFSETVTGGATIRAYGEAERFILESENRVDINQESYYPSIVSARWLSIRLEFVGNTLMCFAALFAVLGRDTLNPGIVGLTISYSLQITQILNFLVSMTSSLETNIVSIERLKEYCEVEMEAEWDIPSNKAPKGWPDNGKVIFDKYTTRYREGLDLVLRGISCEINGGEKVGIIGRTGAGKSSLTLALFRLIEAASGHILIDGIDVGKLGLYDLRSQLTIIPQDPVLFSGSLRMNLDPVGIHDDNAIWQALEQAHLKDFVRNLATALEHPISEGGDNLSVGQRQLVCLARALLRKTKVLVLDEATAAVDLETDDLIQKTIRSEFKECTVLTIAHRLNTIMDSTRVMVLSNGLIAEFDTPDNLLQKKDSVFYSMAKDAGLV